MQTKAARSPVSEEWRASIAQRLDAVHALWQQGVADLTIEQVNHFERPGVLPIAFTLMHFVVGEDRNAAKYLGAGALLWDEQEWAKRVGLVGEPPVRGTPMADAERIRLGDVDAWRLYQTAVFARTESAPEQPHQADGGNDVVDHFIDIVPVAAVERVAAVSGQQTLQVKLRLAVINKFLFAHGHCLGGIFNHF